MKAFEVKKGTHIVFKVEDIKQYLSDAQKLLLGGMIQFIKNGRLEEGKKLNDYYVVNTDEPYAQEVLDVIERGEINK